MQKVIAKKPLVFLLLLFFIPPVSAFHKLKGEFVAEKACPAWQSFRKQTNPDGLHTKPGQRYSAIGENKVGGDWLQVRFPQGLRWVSKQCGQVQASQTIKPDFYTLALTWEPGFCAMKKDRQLPECRRPSGEFVLHGLWPSVRKGAQPAFCRGDLKKPACSYPPLGLDEKQLLELKTIMPGVLSCRQRYQWYKHGACSDMSSSDYFNRAIAATRWFRSAPVTARFVELSGQKVSKQQVLGWFEGLKASESVTLHCHRAKDGRDELTEVRLYLKYDTVNLHHLIKAPFSHSCPDIMYIRK